MPMSAHWSLAGLDLLLRVWNHQMSMLMHININKEHFICKNTKIKMKLPSLGKEIDE